MMATESEPMEGRHAVELEPDARSDAAHPTGWRGRRVVALAGRRVDAADAPVARFPPDHVPMVRAGILRTLREEGAAALVCSAACGADLLALDAAEEIGVVAHVVLPFTRNRFRRTSVTDRPGDWGVLFDRLMDTAERRGALTLTGPAGDDHTAYERVTEAILDRALSLAAGDGGAADADARLAGATAQGTASDLVTAVAVWDGVPRSPSDLTAWFVDEARARGIRVREVRT